MRAIFSQGITRANGETSELYWEIPVPDDVAELFNSWDFDAVDWFLDFQDDAKLVRTQIWDKAGDGEDYIADIDTCFERFLSEDE